MRAAVLLGLALVASASALVEVKTEYHQAVGIPTAKRIRVHEEQHLKQNRIVGGVLAPTNAHPYFAGLLISLVGTNENSVCGSSILTANRLVTAARCWNDGRDQAWQIVVVFGSNHLFYAGTRITTSNVIMHSQYTFWNLHNDIAFIYLPTNISFTNTIQPVNILSPSESWESFIGHWAVAVGFGRTSDMPAEASMTVVNQVSLQVISVIQCQSVYGSNYVLSSTICTNGAGGVGICGGDAGGPLIIDYNGKPTLIGVSSFSAAIGCEFGFPSGFARVNSFDDFVNKHLHLHTLPRGSRMAAK